MCCRASWIADAVELAKLVAMAFTETTFVCPSARALVELEESGNLSVQMTAVIDAKGVWDALAVPDIRPPSESS